MGELKIICKSSIQTGLFDLCKKAAAMKQIKRATSAEDLKKTVGGEITNTRVKSSSSTMVSKSSDVQVL